MNISVIMAAWNVQDYVEEAIRSTLAQAHPIQELIVVDDGSTDGTDQVIRRLASVDPRIRHIRQDNTGFATVANRALSLARSEWVAIADSDDIQHPWRLSELVNEWERSPQSSAIGGAVETFFDDGQTGTIARMPVSHEEIKAGMIFESMMLHPTVMYRRDPFEAGTEAYDPSFRMGMDYKLWWTVLGKARFRNVHRVLTRYRRHPQQLTQSAARNGRSLAERRRIWSSGLQSYLGLEPTEAEWQLHELGSCWPEVWPSTLLGPWDAWLRRILAANRLLETFDHRALSMDLGRRWFRSFRCADRLHPRDLARFFGSPLAWNKAVPFRSKVSLFRRLGRHQP